MVLITTDNGRDAKTSQNYSGQSDRERATWILSNLKNSNLYLKAYAPAITDLLPIMASFLQVNIPHDNRLELDGVSLIDPVTVVKSTGVQVQDTIKIHWKALRNKEPIKIWMATAKM